MQLPWLVSRDEGANCGDARMLALDRITIGQRAQLAHSFRAQRRTRPLGNEADGAWKLDDVEGVGVHVLCYTQITKPELAIDFASSGFVMLWELFTPVYSAPLGR